MKERVFAYGADQEVRQFLQSFFKTSEKGFLSPEVAQAALHFEEQRLRRLERNPRRELARPGGDRLERARRQVREMECDPEHGPAFSPAGRAARPPERRAA